MNLQTSSFLILLNFILLAFFVILTTFLAPCLISDHLPMVFTLFLLSTLPPLTWRLRNLGEVDALPEKVETFLHAILVFGTKPLEISVSDIINSSSAASKLLDELNTKKISRTYKSPMAISLSVSEQIKYIIEGRHNDNLIFNFSSSSLEPLYISVSASSQVSRTLAFCDHTPIAFEEQPNSIQNLPSLEEKDHDIFTIKIDEWPANHSLCLNGLKILNVVVESNASGNLDIYNCWIRNLIFRTRGMNRIINVSVSSSYIGTILLEPTSCPNMEIDQTFVRSFNCTNPFGRSPLAGFFSTTPSVSVGLASKRDLAEVTQGYRAIRAALADSGNRRESYRFRAIELRADRSRETAFTRSFSYIFDFTCLYGNSPERSSIFAILIMAYNGILLGINDLWVVGFDCALLSPQDWTRSLCSDGPLGLTVASLLIGLQPIIDPLAPFTKNYPVLGINFFVVLWMWISTIIVLSLLALTVLGIRRRMMD